jgi:hypothetical protein
VDRRHGLVAVVHRADRVVPPFGLKTVAPNRRRQDRRWHVSLAFDEQVHRAMSNYLVAVNRLRHAQERIASLDDPTQLRELMRAESEAEAMCLQLLVQRGWQPPGGLMARRPPVAGPALPMPQPARSV